MDIRKPDDIDRMVQHTLDTFGRIDILVNNAAANFLCQAEKLSPNGWDAVIDIVLNGSFYASRAVGRMLIERQWPGHILNIISTEVTLAAPATVGSLWQALAAQYDPHTAAAAKLSQRLD